MLADPKNGTCPLVPDLVPCPADAEHVCYVDDHCDGGAKCCYDGCRHYCHEPGGIYTAGIKDCFNVLSIPSEMKKKRVESLNIPQDAVSILVFTICIK